MLTVGGLEFPSGVSVCVLACGGFAKVIVAVFPSLINFPDQEEPLSGDQHKVSSGGGGDRSGCFSLYAPILMQSLPKPRLKPQTAMIR